jgi:hypothetical protein
MRIQHASFTMTSTFPAGSRMFGYLKARWRAFVAVPRGKRFEAHHKRAHRPDAPKWMRIATHTKGLALLGLGIIKILLPGPGQLPIIAGGVLVAEESSSAARILDRLDLAVARAGERWRAWRARRREDPVQ